MKGCEMPCEGGTEAPEKRGPEEWLGKELSHV